jgi:hypothetical protein
VHVKAAAEWVGIAAERVRTATEVTRTPAEVAKVTAKQAKTAADLGWTRALWDSMAEEKLRTPAVMGYSSTEQDKAVAEEAGSQDAVTKETHRQQKNAAILSEKRAKPRLVSLANMHDLQALEQARAAYLRYIWDHGFGVQKLGV